MSTRKALHAGSWYSGSGGELASQLDGWLSAATVSHTPARAIIAPHAGYAYCGSCAGFAYKQVDPTSIKRVFLLGPSHHAYLPGCALSGTTHYETPLYNLEIDQDVYRELEATNQFVKMDQKVDEEEHSIEMHLPYTAKIMESRKGCFKIVPVLVGALSHEREADYGRIFSRYLNDPSNLFIISSDFCHWGKRFKYTWYNKDHGPIHSSIEALDRMGMSTIESINPRAFADYMDKYKNTICGRHPIAVLLNAVDHLCSSQSDLLCRLQFIRYDQSSKCKSTSDSSVSYASASLVITQR